MKRLRVYLAGPMRGHEDYNFDAFDRASGRWRRAGHQPFSPAQIDRALQYAPGDLDANQDALRHVIAMDIASIFAADAIALLPGWEQSHGATLELSLAQFLNLPVYDAITMELINPSHTPWSHHALYNAQRQHGIQRTCDEYPSEYDPDQAV